MTPAEARVSQRCQEMYQTLKNGFLHWASPSKIPLLMDFSQVPEGYYLVDPKLYDNHRLKGRLLKELHARLVKNEAGEIRMLVPDATELNRIWGLKLPESPLVFEEFAQSPKSYERMISERRIPIVRATETLLAHDYLGHAVGYKKLAEMGEYTPYADAMRFCFKVMDSETTSEAAKKTAETLMRELADGLEQTTMLLTHADQGSRFSHALALTMILKLKQTKRKVQRFALENGLNIVPSF